MESRKSSHSSHRDRSHDKHKGSERGRHDERHGKAKETKDLSQSSSRSSRHREDRTYGSTDSRHRTEKHHGQRRRYEHQSDDRNQDPYSHSTLAHHSRGQTRYSSSREDKTKTDKLCRSKEDRKRTSKAWSYYGYTADDIRVPDKFSRNVESANTSSETNAHRETLRTHRDIEDGTLKKQDLRAEFDRCPNKKPKEGETSIDNDSVFDWKSHRRELDAIFFRDDSIIKRYIDCR